MNNAGLPKPNNIYNEKFFENVSPIKLTEARQMKLNAVGWGFISEYYLESVKVTWRSGKITSVATLKIGDRSGRIVCVVRGAVVGSLFGMSAVEWKQVEELCEPQYQLFYRYFKNGLSNNFTFRQKLFYNFCMSNQKTDVLVAVVKRGVNIRNKDKADAFLEILELKKCGNRLLDLYTDYLRKQCSLA